MAGAIAGTALLNLEKTEGIDVVTLTVNNSCNLNCPHCYLQYNGEREYIDDMILDTVLKADFRHLAIVGKEPLYNSEHAKKTSKLVKNTKESGKTVSIITNGVNLHYLENPESVDFVDISFDGGPKTYNLTRRNDYNTLINQINKSKIKEINALHTLYKENIDNIEDMIRINDDAPLNIMLFSPYLETQNQGSNYVHQIGLDTLLGRLADSKEFMDADNTLLNLDLFHAKQYGVSMQEIKDKASKLGLTSKLKLFETDLLKEGVVRVTYDGFVLSPEESLHTANYANKTHINGNLIDAYKILTRP